MALKPILFNYLCIKLTSITAFKKSKWYILCYVYTSIYIYVSQSLSLKNKNSLYCVLYIYVCVMYICLPKNSHIFSKPKYFFLLINHFSQVELDLRVVASTSIYPKSKSELQKNYKIIKYFFFSEQIVVALKSRVLVKAELFTSKTVLSPQ